MERLLPLACAYQVEEISGHKLVPALGATLNQKGYYLLHAENGGRPHCVAVRVSGPKDRRTRLHR